MALLVWVSEAGGATDMTYPLVCHVTLSRWIGMASLGWGKQEGPQTLSRRGRRHDLPAGLSCHPIPLDRDGFTRLGKLSRRGHIHDLPAGLSCHPIPLDRDGFTRLGKLSRRGHRHDLPAGLSCHSIPLDRDGFTGLGKLSRISIQL